jgi:hypothetical protein
MAASRAETKTLERLLAQAKTVSGIGNDRAKAGYIRYGESDNLDALVAALTAHTQGYFSLWLRGVESRGQNEMQTFRYAGELLIRVPKDTSADMTAGWELAMALKDALELRSAYGASEHSPRVTAELREIAVAESLGMAIFDFQIEVASA